MEVFMDRYIIYTQRAQHCRVRFLEGIQSLLGEKLVWVNLDNELLFWDKCALECSYGALTQCHTAPLVNGHVYRIPV